ncbi:MAG: alpha-ribazole phosphatase [Candidatus Syntrophopropionicum ammoniitolerans]
MGCRIYVIRHGETAWNVVSKLQGHTNVPLSDNGRSQARLLGKRLAGLEFENLYSSDLVRAYETAQIISQYHHNLEIKTLPALREINFGRWEGFSIKEIAELYPEKIKQWWKTPLQTRLPDGESLGDLVQRVAAVVKNIVESHTGGNILLVTHGGVIRSIVDAVLGMDLNEHWRLCLENASLNIIDFPAWDKGILMLFNDHSHLQSPCV